MHPFCWCRHCHGVVPRCAENALLAEGFVDEPSNQNGLEPASPCSSSSRASGTNVNSDDRDSSPRYAGPWQFEEPTSESSDPQSGDSDLTISIPRATRGSPTGNVSSDVDESDPVPGDNSSFDYDDCLDDGSATGYVEDVNDADDEKSVDGDGDATGNNDKADNNATGNNNADNNATGNNDEADDNATDNNDKADDNATGNNDKADNNATGNNKADNNNTVAGSSNNDNDFTNDNNNNGVTDNNDNITDNTDDNGVDENVDDNYIHDADPLPAAGGYNYPPGEPYLYRVIINVVTGCVLHLEPRVVAGTLVHVAYDEERQTTHPIITHYQDEQFIEGIRDVGHQFHPVRAIGAHSLATGSGLSYLVAQVSFDEFPQSIRICVGPALPTQFIPSPLPDLPTTLLPSISRWDAIQINRAQAELSRTCGGICPLDRDTIFPATSKLLRRKVRELSVPFLSLDDPDGLCIEDFGFNAIPAHRAQPFSLELRNVASNHPGSPVHSPPRRPAHQEETFPGMRSQHSFSLPQLRQYRLEFPNHHRILSQFDHSLEFVKSYYLSRMAKPVPHSAGKWSVQIGQRDVHVVSSILLSTYLQLHTSLVPNFPPEGPPLEDIPEVPRVEIPLPPPPEIQILPQAPAAMPFIPEAPTPDQEEEKLLARMHRILDPQSPRIPIPPRPDPIPIPSDDEEYSSDSDFPGENDGNGRTWLSVNRSPRDDEMIAMYRPTIKDLEVPYMWKCHEVLMIELRRPHAAARLEKLFNAVAAFQQPPEAELDAIAGGRSPRCDNGLCCVCGLDHPVGEEIPCDLPGNAATNSSDNFKDGTSSGNDGGGETVAYKETVLYKNTDVNSEDTLSDDGFVYVDDVMDETGGKTDPAPLSGSLGYEVIDGEGCAGDEDGGAVNNAVAMETDAGEDWYIVGEPVEMGSQPIKAAATANCSVVNGAVPMVTDHDYCVAAEIQPNAVVDGGCNGDGAVNDYDDEVIDLTCNDDDLDDDQSWKEFLEPDSDQNQWIAIAQDVSVSTSAIVPSQPKPQTEDWGDEVDGSEIYRASDIPSNADFERFRSLEFQLRFENVFTTPLEHVPSPLPTFNWANSQEVWQNMIKKEKTFQRDSGMFRNHPELQPRMRSILLDWLSEVCEVYRLHKETFALCVDLIDRYLSVSRDVSKTQLQLTGISSLFVAAKLEEIYPPKLNEFAYVTDSACSETDIVRQEMLMIKALKWDLSPMTTNAWLGVYLQLANVNRIPNVEFGFVFPQYSSHAFIQISRLCDLCLMDSGSLKFRYSIIAASAIYHHTNEQLVMEITRFNWADLYPCIKWMAPFAKAILEVGQAPIKFFQQVKKEDSHNVQTHNVDMALVDRAQALEATFLEKEKLCPSSLDLSAQLACLLTPQMSPSSPRYNSDDHDHSVPNSDHTEYQSTDSS